MGYIYIYRNKINGKRYIGQTTKTVEERYSNGRGYKNQVFGRALKKYGRENFDLIYVEVKDENLDAIESALIKEFDTTNPKYGYNRESGGNKNKHPSEETKKKNSEAQKGEKNHFYGKHHSEESKMKNAEANEKFHYVIQSPEEDIFETNSLRAFCKEHGLNQGNMSYNGHTKGYILISKEAL